MPEEEQPKKLFTPFAVTNIILFIAVLVSSFYFFYIKKNFNFIIETPCDSSMEQCFIRDCTNPDDCPPNGLSEFKRYTLNANDFKYCQNEDCTNACESGQIKCEAISCVEDTDMGESCSNLILGQEVLNQ